MELNSENKFWIFMAISAGAHLILFFSFINYNPPSLSLRLLEVSLIEIGEPNKPPGPAMKLQTQEEMPPAVPPIFEKEEVVHPVQEQVPALQATQVVSPAGSATQQAELSVSSSGGGGGGNDEAIRAYLTMIKKKIEEAKKYPADALKKGEEGEVYLKLRILPSGNVKDVMVVKSSNFTVLDEFSMKLVKSVAPFLPPPGNCSLSITIPINYKIDF